MRLTCGATTTINTIALAIAGAGAGCGGQTPADDPVLPSRSALSVERPDRAGHRFLPAPKLVSVDATGGPSANGDSFLGSLTPHGRLISFAGPSSNLAGLPDLNGGWDVFVRDLTRDETTLVSVDSTGAAAGNAYSDTGGSRHELSDDGRFVVFESRATNLVEGFADGNAATDIFVRDLESGVTTLVSANAVGDATGNGQSWRPSISGDGRYIAFMSLATDLVAGVSDTNFTNDIFLRDLQTGTTRLLSINTAGTATGAQGGFGSLVSRDGRFVLFSSSSPDLVASPPDTNRTQDVFLHEVASGATRLVSANADGTATANGTSDGVALSDDGGVVAFHSVATDLVAGVSDTNGAYDVFLFDGTNGRTTLVSSRPDGVCAGNDVSLLGALSGDGRVATFQSLATDLATGRHGPITYTAGAWNVFARDRRAAHAEILTVDPTGTVANNRPFSMGGVGSANSTVSRDGAQVVFESDATNLVPCVVDANDAPDVFLHDRRTHVTRLLSLNAAGTATANGFSMSPLLSADGGTAIFNSFANDLSVAPGTVPGAANVYAADLDRHRRRD